jgi:SAM-dependent methyltransferase
MEKGAALNDPQLFVDEDLEAYTGESARERLARTNDIAYLHHEAGIVRVPKSRWATAQAYERRTWMEAAAHAHEDRNEDHAVAFDGYQALSGRNFERAIELGCGPFTNLRMVARRTRVGRCVLLDPLIQSYREHRHCTYSLKQLRLAPSRLNRWLEGSLALRAIRRLVRAVASDALHEGVAVERLIAAPIEEMPECGTFDLVILVNVLEHCFDAQAIFDRVLQLCPPGSVLVFHDRLYMPEDMRSDLENRYDAGHPLRIAAPVIKRFLAERFTPLYEHEIDLVDASYGLDLTERGLYFIGERK